MSFEEEVLEGIRQTLKPEAPKTSQCLKQVWVAIYELGCLTELTHGQLTDITNLIMDKVKAAYAQREK